jgi:hypothetical protein
MMRWARSVKRACALGFAVGAVSLLSASCSSPAVPPHAFVAATLLQGDVGQGQCSLPDTAVVVIGAGEITVPTGANGVTVSCTVSPSGKSFNVMATASNATSAFTIQGTMTNDPTMTQTGITASFSGPGIGYTSNNGMPCTVSFVAIPGEPTATGAMGVADGRVWGNLTCPELVSTNGQMGVCAGTTEFKFEDCGG